MTALRRAERLALREVGTQVLVEYSNPNRATRRSAMRTLRHNTVLYHNEIDRVRALHLAREIRRSKKSKTALDVAA